MAHLHLTAQGSSSVFLSITDAFPDERHSNGNGVMHQWVLTVQSHESASILHSHHQNQIHFVATKSETTEEPYTISSLSGATVIGTILLARKTKYNPSEIHRMLTEDVQVGKENAEDWREEEPDKWMSRALGILQKEGVLPSLKVDQLLDYARAYGSKRIRSEGSKVVAYPQVFGSEDAPGDLTNDQWVSDPAP